MEKSMSESFFSSTTKRYFDHNNLCECGHHRGEHRLLDSYVRDEEEAESNENYPQILCHCRCVTFTLITNLKYLEILEKEKEDSEADIYPLKKSFHSFLNSKKGI